MLQVGNVKCHRICHSINNPTQEGRGDFSFFCAKMRGEVDLLHAALGARMSQIVKNQVTPLDDYETRRD